MADTVSEHELTGEPTRRDFLYLTTAMAGVVGAAAVAWPFIDQMNPDASTRALASIDVEVTQEALPARHLATLPLREGDATHRKRTT